jgi:hypothetical protein
MNIGMEIMNKIESINDMEGGEKAELSKQLMKALAELNAGLMRFEYRFSIMNEFDKLLKEVIRTKIPEFKFDFQSQIPEHLFYTNLGRGDLITFDCWREKYNGLNKLTKV